MSKLKMYGFFATIHRHAAVCREVSVQSGKYLIDIEWAYTRENAVRKFTERTGKKAWGKTVPQFTDIIHE